MNAAAAIAAEVAAITVANGGATYDLAALHTVQTGTAVAVPDHEVQVAAASPAEVAAAVEGYLAAEAEILAQPGIALGTWTHGGTLFLDVVQVTDLSEAVTTAAQAGELAVFDLDTCQELPVPTTTLHAA